MEQSLAVRVALAHIDAWSHHDWDKTRERLAPNVHALVTSTTPNFIGGEFTGIDTYMKRRMQGAQLVEPGSVRVLSTIGDDRNALVLITLRVGLGPGGALMTMARACLYLLDENEKISDERDQFFLLSR
jgi:hypothetical protein